MIFRTTARLALRQAQATLVIGCVLMVVSGSLQAIAGFRREMRQIDEAVAQMAKMVDNAAAKVLYDLDAGPARGIAEGLLEYPMISKAELVDDFGVTLASSERPRTALPYRGADFLLGRRERLEFGLVWTDAKRPVGTLIVHLDAGRILADTTERVLRILAADAATIFLLASVLTAFFYRFVTSPIVNLTREIGHVDMGDPARAKIAVAPAHSGDELGILAKTLNELLVRFGATLGRAQKAEREAVARAEEVARYRDHLEELVKQRTGELERSRGELEQKRRLADIGALAGALAHRLRTPLGVLQLAAYNIRKKAGCAPDLETHLANIDKKVAESNQIISNLLVYSAQLKAPAYARLDLAKTIDECIGLQEVAFPNAHVTVEKKFPAPAECTIEADPFMIKELFCNIIGNAYEAVGENGTIRVDLDRSAPGLAKVRVKDSGPGIEKEALGRIFDPFFTTKVSGMGLGLKICHQIARLHGGSVEVESEAGKGATFIVTLPSEKAKPHA